MKRLPKKMSSLITIALDDLKKVEKDKKCYTVSMGTWHSPNIKAATCYVCLAGAVMAKTLGLTVLQDVSPGDTDFYPQLAAVNNLREGNVGYAANDLELSENKRGKAQQLSRYIPDYNANNPAPFHAAMRKLARDLKAAGL